MSPDWGSRLALYGGDTSDNDIEPIPFADLENPQSLNLYAYVKNSPLSAPDPDGHATDPCKNNPNCVTVTAPEPPPEPLPLSLRLESRMTAIVQVAAVTAYVTFSMKGERGQQHNNPNPKKGAKPSRIRTGKIVGWRIPSADGKGKDKQPHTDTVSNISESVRLHLNAFGFNKGALWEADVLPLNYSRGSLTITKISFPSVSTSRPAWPREEPAGTSTSGSPTPALLGSTHRLRTSPQTKNRHSRA
jgi:hypothetical protein